MRPSTMTRPLALFALLLFAGCAQAPPAVDTAAVEAAVEAKIQAYRSAVAARDTAAILALYAPDARLMPANAPMADTPEKIRAAWVGVLGMPGMALEFTSTAKVVSQAGDMVVDVGTFTFKFQDPTGREITDVGKSLTVFRRLGDDWKIIAETFNSDVPPPGM